MFDSKDDWRLEGRHFQDDSLIIQVNLVQFKGTQLVFAAPNSTALFLNFSDLMWKETQDFLSDNNNFITGSKTLKLKDHSRLFTIIEQRMAAVIFAYSALESFANESIPKDYTYKKFGTRNKCTEMYNNEEIERWISLDEKLCLVLPQILECISIKKSPAWKKYLGLKSLRDRIIHIKTRDKRTPLGGTEKSIWEDLLNTDNPNFALEAFLVASYFMKTGKCRKKPQWFTKFQSELKK